MTDGSLLQNGFAFAALRAADELRLTLRNQHIGLRARGEAVLASCISQRPLARHQVHAHLCKGVPQARAGKPIEPHYVTRIAWQLSLSSRNREDLVTAVQYGAPSRRPPNHRYANRPADIHSQCLRSALQPPKRDRGVAPSVQTQGRWNHASQDGLENRLVHGHVPIGWLFVVEYQAPDAQ